MVDVIDEPTTIYGAIQRVVGAAALRTFPECAHMSLREALTELSKVIEPMIAIELTPEIRQERSLQWAKMMAQEMAGKTYSRTKLRQLLAAYYGREAAAGVYYELTRHANGLAREVATDKICYGQPCYNVVISSLEEQTK